MWGTVHVWSAAGKWTGPVEPRESKQMKRGNATHQFTFLCVLPSTGWKQALWKNYLSFIIFSKPTVKFLHGVEVDETRTGVDNVDKNAINAGADAMVGQVT